MTEFYTKFGSYRYWTEGVKKCLCYSSSLLYSEIPYVNAFPQHKNWWKNKLKPLNWTSLCDFIKNRLYLCTLSQKIKFFPIKKCSIIAFYMGLNFPEIAPRIKLFWDSKWDFSVTASSKNILKTFLWPPGRLETLYLKQFV